MPAGDVRDLLMAKHLEPSRVGELLRPYGFRDALGADRELQAIAEDPAVRARLAAILPGLLEGLGTSADPDGALRRLERFFRAGSASAALSHLTADPRMIEVVTTVFGASPFMAEILTRHPNWLYWLAEPDVLSRARTRKEMARDLRAVMGPLRSEESRLDALRIAKRREILHIGVRDLLRRASVEQTLGALSWLADTLIEGACLVAEEALRTSLGLTSKAGRWGADFAVLGLGKLGGEELNFSSDVDLMYLYGSDEGRVSARRGAPEKSDYFQALARRVTAVLGAVTGEGHVYRVDLRLRPEGRVGPVAGSLRSMQEYYRTRGATWERLALIKARTVAGDRALGRRFLDRVAPFVYRRAFDGAALEDVRRVKRQIDRRMAERAEGDRHVKLGVGGIREIEFVCQVLQVRFGARRPRLRPRATLEALDALREANLLAADEHQALRRAYVFLRDVENKLQIVSDTQVHSLPEAPDELRACALRVGYRDAEGRLAADALLADYRAHTGATHRIFEDVLAGPRLA